MAASKSAAARQVAVATAVTAITEALLQIIKEPMLMLGFVSIATLVQSCFANRDCCGKADFKCSRICRSFPETSICARSQGCSRRNRTDASLLIQLFAPDFDVSSTPVVVGA